MCVILVCVLKDHFGVAVICLFTLYVLLHLRIYIKLTVWRLAPAAGMHFFRARLNSLATGRDYIRPEENRPYIRVLRARLVILCGKIRWRNRDCATNSVFSYTSHYALVAKGAKSRYVFILNHGTIPTNIILNYETIPSYVYLKSCTVLIR